MELLKKRKRYETSQLFACKIFIATNVEYVPTNYLMGNLYWTDRLIGFKILYGIEGETLIDPTNGIRYIPHLEFTYSYHNTNRYYKNMCYIAEAFPKEGFENKSKIRLTKIEELNSILEETFLDLYSK